MASRDVLDGADEIELLNHLERICHSGLVLAFEAALDPPEDVGCQHGVASSCESFGDLPNVVVDSEDLLKQHDPRTVTRFGHGAERIELLIADRDGLVPDGRTHGLTDSRTHGIAFIVASGTGAALAGSEHPSHRTDVPEVGGWDAVAQVDRRLTPLRSRIMSRRRVPGRSLEALSR